MNKEFFKDLLSVEVHITYKDGNRESFTEGTIQKVEDTFIVVVNPDCAIAINFEAVMTCRTKANGVKN
ncbi:unnamed protein product [marine sediment metagenome]|uniref:Uncharacterized protein n=1 Tax=marine sediment metagenome TaxID=412755 RepID=X1EBY7_9ZZZZ